MRIRRPDWHPRPDWYPEPIPGFDVLKWKREVREQMRCETEGMTPEEFCEYLQRDKQLFDEEIEPRHTERADEIHSPLSIVQASLPMSHASLPTL